MSLTWLWLAPALGGLLTLACGKRARHAALAIAAGALAYFLWLSRAGMLLESGPELIFGLRYTLGADGLSLSLCGLTAFLTVISLAASWKQDLSAGFWASFLFLESALLGVFLVRDLFFFYIFWEASLIPMFFIIGLWGSAGRKHAAMKFFLFTFFGSLFLLLGLLAAVTAHHAATGVWTWDMGLLKGPGGLLGAAVFTALVIGFGVKIPIVPIHTWLPDAHTEAPAAGSIMLAGVMLKMGAYGFLRVLLPLFPDLAWSALPALGALAAINILWGSICAFAQKDLKRLVAYSSIAHLGFCLLGLFSRTPEGLAGGALQLLNHGLTTGSLFMLVGFLYERAHKRGLSDFGGLLARAPWLTFFFGLTTMASIGLPGLNGFVGEFLSLAGMARALPFFAVVGAFGVVLSAAYSLPAFQVVFWAEPGEGSVSEHVTDLDGREKALAWTLAILMLAIGLCPGPLLKMLEPALSGLVPLQ
jgi:NADH-quinone oxidoreductase subunit M